MNRTGKIIFGLLLAGLVLFLGASLCSFSPLDPPATVSYPEGETTVNWCGHWGAALAWLLVNAFGLGAWFLLVGGIYTAAIYWSEQGLVQPIVKTLGALVLLASLCGTVAFVFVDYSPGTTYGAGGYLGALINHCFSYCFAPLGSYVFLISLFVAGIILICDWTLIRVFLWVSGIYILTDILLSPFRQLWKWPEKKEPEESLNEPDESNKRVVSAVNRQTGFSAGGSLDNVKDKSPVLVSTAGNIPVAGQDKKIVSHTACDVKSQTHAVQKGTTPEVSEDDDVDAEEFEPVEYICPELDILTPSETIDYSKLEAKARLRSAAVEQAFADYGYHVKVVGIQTGPILTQYEVQLTTGTRLNQIKALEPDIALSLKAQSVRISTISGRGTIGLELPNEDRQLVRLRELMEECNEEIEKAELPLFLGRNVAGRPLVVDLTKMPHLLIAGRTGTGKSVCLNAIIMSILMCRSPEQVRMILIDPKMVELNFYSSIPHLMHPVVTDMRQAEAILSWAVDKMEERLAVFKRAYVRQLSEFNKLSLEELKRRVRPETDEEWEDFPKKIPYVVIVADEMADLMMTAGKEVETHITRLAQKSRAVGIHLVLATQKPTVDIITGLIKSNLPARIAFGVASRTDSLVVLDAKGAEQLLGNGDMLFLQPGTSFLVRGQGTYVSDKEITAVVSEISTVQQIFEIDVNTLVDKSEQDDFVFRPRDSRYEECVNVIFQHGKGKASTSMLQRLLGLGYNRAARIIDSMVADGIISEADQHKPQQPREVLITFAQWQEQKVSMLSNNNAKPEGAHPAKRSSQDSNDFIPIKPAPVVPFTSFDNKNDPPISRPLYPRTVVIDEQPEHLDTAAPWKNDDHQEPEEYNSQVDSDSDEEAANQEASDQDSLDNEYDENPNNEEYNEDQDQESEDSLDDAQDENEDNDIDEVDEDDDTDEEYSDEEYDEALDEDFEEVGEEDEETDPSGQERWDDDKWNNYIESWEETNDNKADDSNREQPSDDSDDSVSGSEKE